MLKAYRRKDIGLQAVTQPEFLASADWIDLLDPTAEETALIKAMGVDIPSLAEMEEIEISNRLYHEGDDDYLTVVLPGQTADGRQISAPVCFVLGTQRLVTIRHHTPRPFDTFALRADKSVSGSTSIDRIFLGMIEEVIGRLADHLESAGHALDILTKKIYQSESDAIAATEHHKTLRGLGVEGERIGGVRLSLLTLGRALTYVNGPITRRKDGDALGQIIKGQLHDIAALEVHADFLSSRLGLASDATLGMINLLQNITVRIVSVVAALFLPPTLIASIYGMNFAVMPELAYPYGYPIALGLMVGSAVATWAFFKWRGWL
jgi:magnesium transporter